MSHAGLSEHDHNLNSVSSQCARGKFLLRENRNSIPAKKKKKKNNHLDFKFYLGKLNNKIFPHMVLCLFCVCFHCSIKQYKKAKTI